MDSLGLAQVTAAIEDAAKRSGAGRGAITLVAVSKGRSNDAVALAAAAGQTIFGENRQQGLAERIEGDLPAGIEWHFVGPLQSRKVLYVAQHVTLLHSMDRISLAHKWAAAGSTPVLAQFNLAAEPQKSGFDPDDADRVVEELLACGVDVQGVMAIPPMASDAELTRPHFARLRQIFERLRDRYDGIVHCSMGMSSDFTVAIEEGCTMVRVGRAIFEATDH